MDFTTNWFEGVRPTWEALIPSFRPHKILEIGSFEGRATTWLIAQCSLWGHAEIHCIDTWAGGIEHRQGGAYGCDMEQVQQRFRRNVAEAQKSASLASTIVIHQMTSDRALVKLLQEGHRETFDMVYIDGSHSAADVLSDAVLSFQLLKNGGLMIFDDYAWIGDPRLPIDHFEIPKPAIDAFVNIYRRKFNLIAAPCLQVYVQKSAY